MDAPVGRTPPRRRADAVPSSARGASARLGQLRPPLRVPLALALALLAALLAPRAATGSKLACADVEPFQPTLVGSQADGGGCGSLKVAIVNGVNYHFEIVAGLLHVLQPYQKQVHVYLSPWIRKENYDGAWDLLRGTKATFRNTNAKEADLKQAGYDLVILVSPDYETDQDRRLVQAMAPSLVVAIVHNADYEHLDELLAMHAHVAVVALSPHVASALTQRTGQPTEWLLPVYPVRPDPDCAAAAAGGGGGSGGDGVVGLCLRGFAMQGKFSNLRRNYTAVWAQMAERLDDIGDPQVGRVFHMNVLGKGPDRLKLPDALQPHVTVHRRLPFQAFYTVICHNLALVPSLANARYFTHKFSSTVITSLSTGTPMIADARMLAAYSFLEKDAVYPQEDGEPEISAMLRISRSRDDDILRVRGALHALRRRINARAFGVLEGFMKRACEAAS